MKLRIEIDMDAAKFKNASPQQRRMFFFDTIGKLQLVHEKNGTFDGPMNLLAIGGSVIGKAEIIEDTP